MINNKMKQLRNLFDIKHGFIVKNKLHQKTNSQYLDNCNS